MVLERHALVGFDAPDEFALALVGEVKPVVAGGGDVDGPDGLAAGLPVAHLVGGFPLAEFLHPADFLFRGVFHVGKFEEETGGDVRVHAEGLVDAGCGLQFERDHGGGVIGWGGRQLEFGPRAAGGPGDGEEFSARDDAGGGDGGLEAGEHQAAMRGPVEDDEVEGVAGGGDVAPRLGVVPRRGAGGIDDLRVAFEPFAGLEEIFRRLRGDTARAVGADVEQVGAAATDGGDEPVEDLFLVLPVLVIPRVGPGIVGGVAGFPEAGEVARGDFHVALAQVVAEAVADAAAEEGAGLGLADEGGEFFGVLLGHVAGGVEPHVVQRAVVRADFLHLRVAFFAEVLIERSRRAVGVLRGAVVAAGGGPVLVVRIVETEAEAGLAGGDGEFLQRVAGERRGVDDVERMGGLEHGEAVVVLRGDDDPLHAGGFRDADDLAGVKGGRVEVLRLREVVGLGDFHLPFDPFADAVKRLPLPLAAEVGVDAPVDEHAVVAVAEEGDAVGGFAAGQDRGGAPHLVHR